MMYESGQLLLVSLPKPIMGISEVMVEVMHIRGNPYFMLRGRAYSVIHYADVLDVKPTTLQDNHKPDCMSCKHRMTLPGETHSMCKLGATDKATIEAIVRFGTAMIYNPLDAYGVSSAIAKGWFDWPFNYDPLWLIRCFGYTKQ